MSHEISVCGNQDRYKDEAWRVSPFRPDSPPSPYQIYLVEEAKSEDEAKKSYHGYSFTIYYHPGDKVETYDWRTGLNLVDRKRRVPCRLYSDEVINFDAITLKDVEYYERNRLERPNYLRILPVLSWIRKLKKEEWELESGFVKLCLSMLGWDEKQEGKVRNAIHWWKLKNKWKRSLMTDDAKAVRMIVKKLKNGENDEETKETETADVP